MQSRSPALSSAPAPIVTKRENNPGNLKVLLAEDFNFVKTQIKNLFLDFKKMTCKLGVGAGSRFLKSRNQSLPKRLASACTVDKAVWLLSF